MTGLIDFTRNVAKNVAAPSARRVMRQRGSYGLEADPAAAAAVFSELTTALESADFNLDGRAVLELGPGRSPELAISALENGAIEYWGVDTNLQLDDRMFWEVGGRAVTLCEYDGRHLPVSSDAIDLIYSKSVLEHVRAGTIKPLLADCWRVLKAGGVMAHIIDLRDHMHIKGDHVIDGDWLEALKYSDAEFRAMFSNRSTYINRLRASEWRDALIEAGFLVSGWKTRREALARDFDAASLHPRWSQLPKEELEVAWVTVTARKPA